MKLSAVLAFGWVSIAAAACIHAAPQQMRDAVTNDDLIAKYRKSVSENPLRNMKQRELKGPDPTTVNQPEDLIATSDFISFRGLSTLIPKRSILNTPKNYSDRIKFIPGSKIVTWKDFFIANRGWVKTVEVTRAQSEGKAPFDEKIAERIQKSSILVVATYRGWPISVLPPQQPAEGEESAKKP